MSKADKEAMARIAGMEYALRRIRETSVEEFAEEVRWRNQAKVGMTIRPQEINEASWMIKARTLDTVLCMAMLVLHDEFGFGGKRFLRLFESVDKEIATWASGGITTGQLQQKLFDATGIDLRLDGIDFRKETA